MRGHKILESPVSEVDQKLPWFLCDTGVRRAGFAVLGVLALAGAAYAGVYAFEAMPWRDAGWASVLFEISKGLVPVLVVAMVAMHWPRAAAVLTVVLGLVAAFVVPVPGAAAMLVALSLLAGALLYLGSHK
jgi:hypothetical protein